MNEKPKREDYELVKVKPLIDVYKNAICSQCDLFNICSDKFSLFFKGECFEVTNINKVFKLKNQKQ